MTRRGGMTRGQWGRLHRPLDRARPAPEPRTLPEDDALPFGDARAWPGSGERFRWMARVWMGRRVER